MFNPFKRKRLTIVEITAMLSGAIAMLAADINELKKDVADLTDFVEEHLD
jgi:hypothetical protein